MPEDEFQMLINPNKSHENQDVAPNIQRDLSEESKHEHIQIDFASAGSSSSMKRKRGRPKGSKNKPKQCKLHSKIHML